MRITVGIILKPTCYTVLISTGCNNSSASDWKIRAEAVMSGSDCCKCALSLAAMSVRGYAKSIRHIPVTALTCALKVKCFVCSSVNCCENAPCSPASWLCWMFKIVFWRKKKKCLHISNPKSDDKHCEFMSFLVPYFVNNPRWAGPGTFHGTWRHTRSSACPDARSPTAVPRTRGSRSERSPSTPQSCGAWWMKWGKSRPAESSWRRVISENEKMRLMRMERSSSTIQEVKKTAIDWPNINAIS